MLKRSDEETDPTIQSASNAAAMRVLIANSPFSYREAFSLALKELRPHLEVFTAEPEELDERFVSVRPHLVVCSQSTEVVRREALGWVELYPGYGSESFVGLGGHRSAHPEMDFEGLLQVVDEAERLHHLYENT